MLTRPAFSLLGFRSRWFETTAGTFHCLEAGGGHVKGAHPPLLILHGMCTTGQCMAPLGALLAAPNRRVIVPDLMGFDFGVGVEP